MTAPPERPIPQHVIEAFRAKIAAEERRRAAYGDVRPIISTVWQDHRFVAVGATLYWDKAEKWRVFTDFLGHYIRRVLGLEWGLAELEKPLADRHVIMQWAEALRQLKMANPEPDERGICSAEPDGPSYAYLLLAYDLYLLGDHGTLRDAFVERLKRREEFQSARYELFVAATMIRAGFDIKPENERDLTRQHPEYVATHRVTTEPFAVEAKSRRIPGVLGFAGEPVPADRYQLDVRQLLRRALEKRVALPYIVFLDANMPPGYAAQRREEWTQNVLQAVQLGDETFSDIGIRVGSLFNLLVVTNVPDHYGEAGGPLPEPVFYTLRPVESRRPVRDPAVFGSIERALAQSHRVPVEFPPDGDDRDQLGSAPS